MQCLRENGKPSEEFSFVEFRDNGRYQLTCKNGHQTTTILQQQKFEILFDIGAYAILDGYYREAVSSFTSSLERFYEFFVKAILLSKGLDEENLQETWKQVAKQSERQIGAFIITHASEFRRPPLLMSNRKVQFRNDVIHRGKIPTRQEAVEYGQAVLDVVRPNLRQLKEKCPEGIQKTIFQHLKGCRVSEDAKQPVSTMSIATILSLSIAEPGHDERSLEKALSELKRWG